MESCDEALIKDKSRMHFGAVAAAAAPTVQQRTAEDGADCANSANEMENKQKYDFGAEIATTKLINEELEMKTNAQKIKTNGGGTTTTIKGQQQEEEEVAAHSNLPMRPIGPVLLIDMKKDNANVEEMEEADDVDSYQSDDNSQQRNHAPSSSQAEDDDDDDGSEDDDEDDDDDESGTDSNYSEFSSGMSEMSGREWKPISARPIHWVQKQITSGANPRELISQMLPSSAPVHALAPSLNDNTLWRILASLLSEPPRRQKLRHINTFDDVLSLVLHAQNIIVLTGAGVSVSCGIPDFRSSDGIYSRLSKDFPDLPDPQAMFDIAYFSRDPRPFYKFAREIYPGQFRPSPCHRFIRLLEQKQKLLRNYTQNIDTLEQVAGIRNVIECHGSFSTASCTKCKFRCDADAIRADIFAQRIPVCPRCQPHVRQSVDARQEPPVSELELRQLVLNGIMKPDIVFFGEGLPDEFHTVMASDKDKCDLLIVMGSSLKVRPVALIPSSIPAHVPQILINREQLHHLEFDVELLGDSDVIINQLCHRLASSVADGGANADDWKAICYDADVMRETKELLPLLVAGSSDPEDEDAVAEEEEEDEETEETVTEEKLLLQDNDTQSVKSNGSTDLALRSYSDSGFESSTSSGVVVGGGGGGDFGNPPGFHPFAERLEQPAYTGATAAVDSNHRHLSVDSSKDSGIQGDSSNLTNFGDSGGGGTLNANALPPPAPAATVAATKTAKSTNSARNSSSPSSRSSAADCGGGVVAGALRPHRSAAERLRDGTYYCHESSASYVFPGAQVSWSDSEDDAEAEIKTAAATDANFMSEEVAQTQTSTGGNEKTPTAAKKRQSSSAAARDECIAASSTTSCTITQISNTDDVDDDDDDEDEDLRRPPSKVKRCESANAALMAAVVVASNQNHAEASSLLQQLL